MAPRLLLCLVWLSAAPPLAAQSYTYLFGAVRDPSDAAVPGASITVVDQDTGFRRVAATQDDGSYLVASLRPGTYKITIRKEGFRTVVEPGFRLEVGQPARADFKLSLGSMQEVITVEGMPSPLDTQDAAIGTLVDRERIERLPLNGHNLLSLIELAPGTVVTPATRGEPGQFTANGQRPNTHYFTLDGVSVNSGVSGGGSAAQITGGTLPGMTALGSFHNLVSLDALEEFRIQTATTAPEFGRMPGAQVVLSSRSGSNQLHGSAAEYFRHERLAANDWFANRLGAGRAPLRAHDYGGTLGGPLKRDRTFFFLGYEGLRLRQPFAWRTAVPSLDARASATGWVSTVLDLFPLPNGGPLGTGLAEWTGINQRPSHLDTGSVRLDHALSSRITLFTRYSQTPSFNEFGDTQINSLSLDSRSLTAGASLRVKPSLAFDLRFNYSLSSAQSSWQPADGPLPACFFDSVARALGRVSDSCVYLVRFSIAGMEPILSGPESDRRQSQSHLAGTAMLGSGTHQLRVGAEYRRLSPWRKDRAQSLSIIAETAQDFYSASGLWVASAPAIEASTTLGETSLFLQDTWRVADRLTATLGARWDLQPEPSRIVAALNPYSDSGLWERRYSDVAPRLGLAFRPVRDGNTVLRAGGGLYYNSSLSIATDLINGGPFSIGQYTSNRLGVVASYLGYAFAPGLRTPWVAQWSASVEHSTPGRGRASLAYTGSRGGRLLRRELGGPESNERLQLVLATNHGASAYHALEAEYRGRLGPRVQALLSYAWAHSIDNSSSDSALYWTSPYWSAASDRGASDFDVRHSFAGGLTFQSPHASGSRRKRLSSDWQLDGILHARSGFPFTVADAESATGLSFANAFRPNLLGGVSLWIDDPTAPHGVRLNPAAFQATTGTVQGNLGRNALRGFGMSQLDLALRREFPIREKIRLAFGLEAFNALNQALFADPVRYLSSPLFGQSTSMLNLMLGTGSPSSGMTPLFQAGGPRSIEAMLRIRF